MKKNIGAADKIIRLIVAAIFAVLFFTHVVSGVVGFVLLALSGILIVTSFMGFCPLYFPFGIKTNKTS